MIYLLFRPIEFKSQALQEIPVIELQNFTIYELDQEGLKSIFGGANSKRYSDRDVVEKIDFTDSTNRLITNIKAGKGTHKPQDILLEDEVVYTREDGLTFKSEAAHYEKNSSIFSTDQEFVIYRGESFAVGKALIYDSKSKITNAQNIKTIYQLQESKE